MTRAMRRMRKYLIVVACIALIAGVAIGGTIAWLQDTTQKVTNTFAPTNIDLTLIENGATAEEGSTDQSKDYTVIPGVNMPKDPKVSAESDVNYYVFVKVDATGWTVTEVGTTDNSYHTYKTLQDKISCAIVTDWKFLAKETVDGKTSYVYYQAVSAGTEFKDKSVLVDNQVVVDKTLTDEMMNPVGSDGTATPVTIPSLTFTAYAIQQANGYDTTFTAAEAWAEAKKAG